MPSPTALVHTADRVSARRMAVLQEALADPGGSLLETLRFLVQRVDGALGASLADANGLPIASTFSGAGDLRLASALATMIARTAHLALDGLGHDRLQAVIIEGSNNVVLVCDVSEGVGSLILVVDREGDLVGARQEIVRTSMEVTTILDLDVS